MPRCPHALVELLHEAARLGVRLSTHGADLDLEAGERPPAAFLEQVQAFKPELLELLQPPPESGFGTIEAPWTDERSWLGELLWAGTEEEKLAVLVAWVIRAGGTVDGMVARVPPLNFGLAAVALRRLLKQAGIELREQAEKIEDRCRYCHELVSWTGPGSVAFADSTFAHVTCYDEAETLRQSGAATFDPNKL